jgi:predicted XRE-type DNA-binding protein
MDKLNYQRSSGNVYKDLDFKNAEEMQAKAALASSILSIIERRKWTQEEAAQVLKIPQPKVSLLARGRFRGFSMEKLIKLLNKLNQDIDIVIKDKKFSINHIGHLNVIHSYI